MKAPAETAATAAKRWRESLKSQGFVKFEMWIPADMKSDAKRLELALRNRALVSVSPSTVLENPMTLVANAPWTIASLKQALESCDLLAPDEISCAVTAGLNPTLHVTMNEYGDLPVFISVQGEQILVSTLLWPVASQPDTAAFNEMALRSHKLMPLSSFGITTVNGVDFYELFGALSSLSALPEVVDELRTLAANAIDVAEARAAA